MASVAVVTTRPGVFMRIETDPVIRIWTGSHPYRLPADDVVEIEGGEYLGLALNDFPVLDRMINDQAGEYTFTLSGIEQNLIDLLDVPLDFSGSRVSLGQLRFDKAWRPLSDVDWIGDFDAEHIGLSIVQDGDGHSASIAMTVGSASTDRRLAIQLHWSSIEQRDLSSTDAFFDFVANYPTGARRQYPA